MCFNLLLSEDFSKYAANVTVSGLVIVFAMLVLLVLTINVFGKIMSSAENRSAKNEKTAAQDAVVSKTSAPTVVNTVTGDDDEIIAVISAAVAALYSSSEKTPVIRSIKPSVTQGRSAWGMAGLNQNVKSF